MCVDEALGVVLSNILGKYVSAKHKRIAPDSTVCKDQTGADNPIKASQHKRAKV